MMSDLTTSFNSRDSTSVDWNGLMYLNSQQARSKWDDFLSVLKLDLRSKALIRKLRRTVGGLEWFYVLEKSTNKNKVGSLDVFCPYLS